MKNKISAAFGIFSVVVSSYYIFAVLKARNATADNVARAKSSIAVPVNISDLPKKRLDQLLAIQDKNFFDHGGTDFTSGRITTITQGLVKFMYFENFEPGIAKIEQSLFARFALDPLVSKDEQLYLFLSLVYFGLNEGKEVRGFGQASQVYFGKEFSEISQDEYLTLLVMLSSPDGLNIKRDPVGNAKMKVEIKQKIAGLL